MRFSEKRLQTDVGLTDLNLSIADGIFAHLYATLTGGVFLTGFALYLGMNEFLIGLLASIPFFVTVFQLPAAVFIRKTGRRKAVAWQAATAARLLWVPIVLTAFALPASRYQVALVLFFIFLSHASASVSYVSWLSWTSDLIPARYHGRFFGVRNMLCGAAGMAASLAGGRLLDAAKLRGQAAMGFSVIMLAAVLFGLVSAVFLGRISDPDDTGASRGPVDLKRSLTRPFRDRNFRRFLLFNCLWSFSVYFASPFFALYFLRDLKFSYSFIALLSVVAALSDLLAMPLWGRLSDKVRNKAVIRFAGWVVVFLPLAWTTVTPDSRMVPILLQLVGGGFWAGVTLCINNLLLGISPREEKPLFFSTFNMVGGLSSAAGAALAGYLLKLMSTADIQLFGWKLLPIQIVFIVSTLLRLASLQRVRPVAEPDEMPLGRMIRVLRNVRGLHLSNGFSSLLHPFVEITKKTSSGRRRSRRS